MKKILIIDIETTGFINKGGKIVEVGIVELDLDNGKRKIIFDNTTYEKDCTEKEIENSWIVQNTSLTTEEIFAGLRFIDLKPIVQSLINTYPLGTTAYNNVFDFKFLESRDIEFPKKLPCPMLLSTNVCKIKNKNRGGYKWPKVQEAYDYFFGKTDYIEEHRGADDAMHEAEIVYELYKRGIFKL